MPKVFVCSRGHRWTSEPGQGLPGIDGLACPHCGAVAQTLLPSAEPGGCAILNESRITETSVSSPERLTPQAIPGYVILSELGEGGMGVVYKARQLRPRRLVALKVMRRGEAAEHDRFRAEGEAVARLQHPNIVQVYEVGEHGDHPFLALEFIEGGSLERKLANSRLPPHEAAELVRTLAQAMQHAHDKGVIHRDLKPGNVLLTTEGTPKIADFGLAKRLDVDLKRTQTGVVMGTPAYMAPEQARGQVRAIGPATDVWALGVILYEMLTGQPPFRGETTLETIEQVCTHDPVAPRHCTPQIPADLETICLKCLEKESARRYVTAGKLADELGRFLDGEPIHARPVGVAGRLFRRVRRRPLVTGLLLLTILTTLGLAGAFWQWQSTEARRQEIENARRLAEEEAASQPTELVPTAGMGGHEWRYTFTDPGGDWQQVAFDDKHWKQGKSAFASRGNPALMTRTPWTTPDIWLRTTMELPDLEERTLVLRLFHDDDVEVFVNGHQLLRQPGAIGAYREIVLSTRQHNHFHPGENVLAVHCRCTGGGQGIDLGLEARPPHLLPTSSEPSVPRTPSAVRPLSGKGEQVFCLSAHRARRLTAMALSADGKRVLTGGDDGTVRLWDLATGEELMRRENQGNEVLGICFVPPDERQALSCGTDRHIRLWDLATGQQVRHFFGHTDRVLSVVASPDGKRFVSAGGSRDHRLAVWDFKAQVSGSRPRVLRGACLYSLCWPKVLNGPISGSCRTGTGVYQLDLDKVTGKRLFAVSPGQEVFAVAVSRDGRLIAAGGTERIVTLWDVSGKRKLRDLPIHDSTIRSVAFSPDGRRLASAGGNSVQVWDVATGLEIHSFHGHEKTVNAVAFLPDGRHVLSGSDDGTLRLWRLPDERFLEAHLRRLQEVSPAQNGLRAELYIDHVEDGVVKSHHTLLRSTVDAEIDFTWKGTGPDRALTGPFSVRWTGRLLAPWPGRYKLAVQHTGGVVLRLDGQKVIDAWKPGAIRRDEAFVELGNKPHALEIGYFGDARDATVRLLWSQVDSFLEQVVPTWALLHDEGGEVRRFSDPEDLVKTCAVSPDGKYLVTGNGGHWRGPGKGFDPARDQALRVWDLDTGKLVQRLRGHEDVITNVAFSPDGHHILSCGLDKTARLWDVQTGKEVRSFAGPKVYHYGAIFSPDGRYALIGYRLPPAEGGATSVGLWEVATGKLVRWMEEPGPFFTTHLAFSPKGQRAAACTFANSACVWDVATGKLIYSISRNKAKGLIDCVCFSPDGESLLVCGANGASLWEAETGKFVRRFEENGTGVRSALFTRDGKHIVTAGYDGVIRCYAVASGMLLKRIEVGRKGLWSLAWRGAGSEFVFVDAYSADAFLWQLPRLDRRSPAKPWIRRIAAHRNINYSIQFSPDGRHVLTGSGVWDQGHPKTWKVQLCQLPNCAVVKNFPECRISLQAQAFSPDSRLFATSDEKPGIRLWDVASRKEVGNHLKPRGPVGSLAFSPDGRHLLSRAAGRGGLQLWDVKTRKEVRSFPNVGEGRRGAAFTPDSRRVLTAETSALLVLDAVTGKLLHRCSGHTAKIHGLTMSSDNRLAATASLDGTARIWDIQTGKQVRLLRPGGTTRVNAVAFSPDGRWLATADHSGRVALWDPRTGDRRCEWWLDRPAYCVAFTPDGREVASGGQFAGRFYLFPLPEEFWASDVKVKKPEDKEDVKSTPAPKGAIVLFDGKSLEGWVHRNGKPATWELQPGGAMQVKGGDIHTREKFDGKFKLHVEFRVPYMPKKGGQGRGNSGVYLQGRHEVQVLDSYGVKSQMGDCGAIYGVAIPRVNACKAPTVWQSYDIEFTSPVFKGGKQVEPARMTVYHNGVKIHDNQPLVIKKGGKEAFVTKTAGVGGDPSKPGPIMLQDHGDPVQYRNIWLLPLKD